jgi:thioredoxin 1
MKTAKYFTATWCGPCKAFKPVMNEIINEGHSVQILDIDANEAMARQYNVRSVPTTIIEENGVEVDRFVGALPKETVKNKLS